MKALLIAILAALSSPVFAQMVLDDCEFIEAKSERVNCLNDFLAQEDRNLNANYQEVKRVASTETFASLQKVQREWIGFRDRDCKSQKDLAQAVLGTGFEAELKCKAMVTSFRAKQLAEIAEFLNMNTEGNETE